MKYTLLLSTIFSLLFWNYSYANGITKITKLTSDSSIINHVLDGSTSEWPDNKFELDKETNIKYAIDNNAQDMFLALIIPDFRTQMKMMRLGMNLFIDMKGKKKENRGIEFPDKRDDGASDNFSSYRSDDRSNNRGNDDQENGQPRKLDKKAIRNSMALNLIFMKIFGFSNGDPVEQGLQMEGSAQIAFTWDSADIMHIEYLVPLKMLKEPVADLNQKNISIGWKINDIEMSSNANSSFESSSFGNSGGRGGRRGGFSRGSGENSNNFSQADRQKMTEPQSFWTKYTFIIPADAKSF